MRLGLALVLIALGAMVVSCSGDSDGEQEEEEDGSEPTERQHDNAASCQQMQDPLAAQSCETAYTSFRCAIYEGVSGDCVPWFECLEAAACDIDAQRECEAERGKCGDPG
jgi:hypothetical protein